MERATSIDPPVGRGRAGDLAGEALSGCVNWWGQMTEKYFEEQAEPSHRAD